jgi:hypothetical protein
MASVEAGRDPPGTSDNAQFVDYFQLIPLPKFAIAWHVTYV